MHPTPETPAPPTAVLDPSPDVLEAMVRTFLEALGAEISSLSLQIGRRTTIAISSPASKVLIGPRGEHLRALNLLVRKLVERAHGEGAANFLIDINGYHEEQLEKVREKARMLAQRARLFKHDVELEPMSAYERLVIHELFAEDPEIETRSEGEGKFRHIVLHYR